ncbi:MAG: hypothetical protein U1C54_06940 [Xanthomonadaceae bacterium]|nr:hypothetical protein [Xanthomonadaceae bacterium]
MALSFTPATPADEETLASFIPPDANGPEDLPTSLPAGVIDLIAEYSIDGQTVARGGTYGLGYTVNTRQRLFEPGAGWREIDNTLAAGDYQAVGLDVSGISIAEATALQTRLETTKAQLDSQQFAGLSKHDLTGAILQAGIVGYFAQTWGKGQIMARTANVLLYRLPSVGTLSTASSVTFWFGVPRRFIPSGVAFDVDRNALSSTARDDDRARWIAFNRSYNQVLSAHEHSVLEDMFSTPTQPVLGVSTVKAIAVAAQQGQRIYTITQDNLSTALNQITLPADVETDIANAVNAGFQVTTHQTDIQYAGLITAGYAIEDPNTGVGAMLISSGASGGFSFIAGLLAGVLLGLVVLLVAAPWGLLVVASSFVLSQIAGPLLIKVISLIGGEENIDGLCFLSGFLSSFILMIGLLRAAIGILIAGGVSTIVSNAIPGLPNASDCSKR